MKLTKLFDGRKIGSKIQTRFVDAFVLKLEKWMTRGAVREWRNQLGLVGGVRLKKKLQPRWLTPYVSNILDFSIRLTRFKNEIYKRVKSRCNEKIHESSSLSAPNRFVFHCESDMQKWTFCFAVKKDEPLIRRMAKSSNLRDILCLNFCFEKSIFSFCQTNSFFEVIAQSICSPWKW